MNRRRLIWALVALVGVAIVAGPIGSLVSRALAGEHPATTLVATTVLEGEISPDPAEGVDPTSIIATPNGHDCLDRIDTPGGPLDLCWNVGRSAADADPSQDYYRLKVLGTYGGASGTGLRWLTVRARLTSEPSNRVFEGWPTGILEGGCQAIAVDIGSPGIPELETVCGRTVGTTNATDWSHEVAWTCGCLLPNHDTRGIVLYEWVAMPAGRVPTWEVFADLSG